MKDVGPMKLVGYLRVSTETQAERGAGLDVQRDTIRSWAKEHGHRVVLWCVDEGISGSKDLEERDGLAEALDAVRFDHGRRQADGLVVYRLDRLARDLVVQEQMLADIWRADAVPFSTSAGEQDNLVNDPDDPSRAMIRQILGAVAEYERKMIALRLRTGRRRKHREGGYAYGAPPYGAHAVERELEPAPDEQRVIGRMRKLRARGRSYREIAAELNDDGVPAKRGGQWHPMTVRRTLQRPAA